MKNQEELQMLLQSPRNVVVIMHFKPDADALGSSLGLAGFLKKLGHRVQVVAPSNYPEFLAWLPGNEQVLAVNDRFGDSLPKAVQEIEKADILFCLDFNNPNRVNTLEKPLRDARGVKVMIDHHLEPENFADFQKWNTQSASTAGLVFDLIHDLKAVDKIDADIATCLYAGLMTDTGGFRHNNTRHQEFLIASSLVAHGADPHVIAKKIYDNNTLERLRLTGFALYEKLVVVPEYRTAYMALSGSELSRFNAQTGDLEGLVNYGLSIEGVRMAVLMYDRKDEVKLSFRSLGDFSVNELARKHFNGGGHRNAAGGQSKTSLQATLEKLLALLPEYKNQLNA